MEQSTRQDNCTRPRWEPVEGYAGMMSMSLKNDCVCEDCSNARKGIYKNPKLQKIVDKTKIIAKSLKDGRLMDEVRSQLSDRVTGEIYRTNWLRKNGFI